LVYVDFNLVHCKKLNGHNYNEYQATHAYCYFTLSGLGSICTLKFFNQPAMLYFSFQIFKSLPGYFVF